MRTLLVDNYDSFTYNLFHYLAEVNGQEPVVIRNDDTSFRPRMLRTFDSVVISPGPGSPEREADFGICHEIIDGPLPVLGVCLGHQGIAHAYGARVSRAPEPRHGRLSKVLHQGTELFADIPSPFEVVRYHSLAVTDLPDELEETARADDGVLMGIRHRSRPLWGVQFHPESISTSNGHDLLRNFRHLAEEFGRATATAAVPATANGTSTSDRVAAVASEPAQGPASRSMRVLVESLPTRWSDEVAFDRLFRSDENAFWLDSSSSHGENDRFSVMGDSSGPLARVVRADVWQDRVTIESATGSESVSGAFLTWLEEDLRSLRVDVPELPFDFALGWVGYLGYELKAECGGDRVHRSAEPDAAMIFADRALVFDHATRTTYLLALAEDGDEQPARAWLADTTARLAELAGREPDYAAPEPPTAPRVRLRHDRARYLKMIDHCREQIAAGETYEVCLTNMLHAETALEPWQSYQFLRRTSPAPFAALLRFGSLSVLSTSPERFLRISADGTVESKPIKGTRPRSDAPDQDEMLRLDLANNEKDRSENLMIVDLVRNDLGRTAEVGSVSVPKIYDVEPHPTTFQLVSTVRSQLRPTSSAVECVRNAFPGGSMTGAPKIRTMQIIDGLEEGPRGVYSGALGYFSLSGACDLSIVIRTLVMTPSRVTYGIGGAIVALSDRDEEFEETAVKATPMLRLLSAEFPGRVPVAPSRATR